MKIPATLNGENVYIVGFVTVYNPNGRGAICIQHDGSFRIARLENLTVRNVEAEEVSSSFVPPESEGEDA